MKASFFCCPDFAKCSADSLACSQDPKLVFAAPGAVVEKKFEQAPMDKCAKLDMKNFQGDCQKCHDKDSVCCPSPTNGLEFYCCPEISDCKAAHEEKEAVAAPSPPKGCSMVDESKPDTGCLACIGSGSVCCPDDVDARLMYCCPDLSCGKKVQNVFV